MWDKQFEQASWNGTAFNILKTVRDGGKRLQVVELPYKDDPSIWILGGKAKGYKIDAVFVGANALRDANAFESVLDSDPVGNLEHPYLGELNLVYQTSSMAFSTKHGIVTLSLKFIKQGALIEVPTTSIKSIKSYTQEVIKQSADEFVRVVKQANANEIAIFQQEFTTLLQKLRLIANQMQRPGIVLSQLNNQINDGLSAISTIANAPKSFAEHVSATLNNLASQLNQATITNPSVKTATTTTGDFANRQLKQVEQSSTNKHIKTLTTMTTIETNVFINTSMIAASINIEIAEASINAIALRVNDRLTEATEQATFDGYDLVVSIERLTAELAKHQARIDVIKQTLITTSVFTPIPELALAHKLECPLEQFDALNAISHPLFVTGKVRVPNE